MEHLKKIPWEVWVGLALTVLVAWWTTKSSVSAGQATAQGVIASQAGTGPGTSSGLGQELGTYQAQTLTAIGDLQRQNNNLANTIGTSQDVTSGNQQSLFGQIGAANAATAAGLANVNTAVSGVSTQVGDLNSQVAGLGTTLASTQQTAQDTLANTQQTLAQVGQVEQGQMYTFYQIPNRYAWQWPFGPGASQSGTAANGSAG